MTIRRVDLGEYAPLRWGVVHQRPGHRDRLIATFRDERQRDAYVIQRDRAERRVCGRRATGE